MAKGSSPQPEGDGECCPSRRVPIPFDSARRGMHDFRPVDSSRKESEASYPGLLPRRLAGTGPVFLLGIALLCMGYSGIKFKQLADSKAKAVAQLRADPAAQPPIAKPSPLPPVVAPQPENPNLPELPPHVALKSPRVPTVREHPMKYEATHKKAFGGCAGQLELTSSALQFRCPHEAQLDIPVSFIAGTDKDGVLLASGEKYHFVIANYTKSQVETLFYQWLTNARQVHQSIRNTSF
jgi:hypothetical protein